MIKGRIFRLINPLLIPKEIPLITLLTVAQIQLSLLVIILYTAFYA